MTAQRMQEMQEMQEYYGVLLNNLSDGIFVIDQEMNIAVWNESAERITGYSQAEIQQPQGILILDSIDRHGVAIHEMDCPIIATFQDGSQRVRELFLRHKKGYRVPVVLKVAPIFRDTEPIAVMVVMTDNSMQVNQKEMTNSLEQLSMTDPLTGLSSRKHIQALLQARLENYRLYRDTFGVAFINLDDFSDCNDIYGFENGNKMLQTLAEAFQNMDEGFVQFGRWGGEEFIAILEAYDRQQLKNLSEALRQRIENTQLKQGHRTIGTTASIGATMADGHDTVQELVERAVSLMHVSKISGKNCTTLG